MKSPILVQVLGGLLLLGSATLVREARSCTAFLARGTPDLLVAKNLDWRFGHGLVFIEKRNVLKRGLPVGGQPSPIWISKWMSLTLTLTGRDFPWEGLNEAGLSVTGLRLEPSVPPPSTDPRPVIDSLQWMQYVLDTAGTVEEAVAQANRVRVTAKTKIHYFVCDAGAECAVLEYVDGRLVVYRGKDLPYPALANGTYADSRRYFEDRMKAESPEGIVARKSADSRDRFSRAALFADGYADGEDEVEYAFSGLANLAQRFPAWRTYWSMVFALRTKTVYLRTFAAPETKRIDLTKFDPSCVSGSEFLDVNRALSGEASPYFGNYAPEVGRALIAMPPLRSTEVRRAVGTYPERYTRCLE